MNSQSSSSVFRALQHLSHRRLYTITQPSSSSLRSPSTTGSRLPSSRPCVSSVIADSHGSKRRRYSSEAAVPAHNGYKPWGGSREAAEQPIRQRGETTVSRTLDHEDANTEPDSGSSGLIVRPGKYDYRDKQGRPWIKPTEDKSGMAGAGAQAVEVGVAIGVGVSASPKRRKPRIELRDLSVKPKKKKPEPWQAQKNALEKKFGDEGWSPRKKLSPDAMEGIRALHEQDPERWATPLLADHFKVSPESIRRILKSKWKPKDDDETQKRKERWARRHDRIWDHQAELGLRPQREHDRQVEDPEAFEEDLRAKQMLDNARRV